MDSGAIWPAQDSWVVCGLSWAGYVGDHGNVGGGRWGGVGWGVWLDSEVGWWVSCQLVCP